MACMDPEGIMEQEQAVMGMLSHAELFSIQENYLEILTTSSETLIFIKVEGSD